MITEEHIDRATSAFELEDVDTGVIMVPEVEEALRANDKVIFYTNIYTWVWSVVQFTSNMLSNLSMSWHIKGPGPCHDIIYNTYLQEVM